MDEEIEIEVVDIDKKEYYVIDEEIIDGSTYVFLSNPVDNEDFCVRKVVIENDEKTFYTLDTDKEFDKCMEVFLRKFN